MRPFEWSSAIFLYIFRSIREFNAYVAASAMANKQDQLLLERLGEKYLDERMEI